MMILGMWEVGFKIRKKTDVDEFLNGLGYDSELYWERDDNYDYCLSKNHKGNVNVCSRSKDLRGNVFNPYCECGWEDKNGKQLWGIEAAKQIIWRDRKYINREMFGK